MTVTLQDAITAINAGDKVRGRQLLAQLLQQEPENESAWIWMSGTVDDTTQRRFCLEKALAINPDNPTALSDLANLGVQPPAPPPPPLARMDHGLGQSNVPVDDSVSAFPQSQTSLWSSTPETSEEPEIVEDVYIGDIVAAINKEESSTPPPQDTDLNWLLPADKTAVESEASVKDSLRDVFSDFEPVSTATDSDMAESTEALSAENIASLDFETDLNPDLDNRLEPLETGTPPFADINSPDYEFQAFEPTPGQIWENPKGGSARLTILTDKYLITANPKKKVQPQIEASLAEGQVQRSLLGRSAKPIPLAHISTVRAPGNSEHMEVIYQREKDSRSQIIYLVDPVQRDEVFTAMQARLGNEFQDSVKKYSLFKAISGPGLTLAILALLTGLLYYGALLLEANPSLLTGSIPALVEQWLSSLLAVIGSLGILFVGVGLILIVLLWLFFNLRKPSRTQVLERKTN